VLRAVAAHRAYVDALAEWERAFHAANCPDCRNEPATEEEHALHCASAEAEKERRRVVFRDLCDELGYVPEGHGITFPGAECPSREHDSQA
jgi:hypothetical protein